MCQRVSTTAERGKPADFLFFVFFASIEGLEVWTEASGFLEEDLGSDGEAGRASNSHSRVILTTETGWLMTGGNNNTHIHW